ncbi:MAG TPA: DUF3943 domain-containing protein [Woeseiaceae bacterium]|nr:DUF3943 domain-containing protein [Woeseiaceae bacterium]
MGGYRAFAVVGLSALLCLVPVSGHAEDTDEYQIDVDDWQLQHGPDREGLNRDTLYFLGYQWITIGILYALPESVTSWTPEQKSGYSLSIWWDKATSPTWDSDKFYLNYILHPYWGASYFVRAKERGYSDMRAFWYAAMLSAIYEFGAEALFEQPSIQDLIFTPVLGSLLGKYFMNVRGGIRERDAELGYRRTRDKWVWVLTDPLGALNRQVDKLFRRDTSIAIAPFNDAWLRDVYLQPGPATTPTEPVYGFELQVRW